MSEVTETLLTQKIDDSYSRSSNLENFKAECELTVTITLSEYRKLVSEVATKAKDISEANSNKWERESKITTLEKKVNELDNLVFEYRKRFGNLNDADVSESEE